VKWAQNQSLGEKWAATSKRLRSTDLGYPSRGPHRKTIFLNEAAEEKSLRRPGIKD